MAANPIHVSISAEKLFSLGGLDFTNSMVTSLIVSGLLISFAIIVRSQLTSTNRPKGLQNLAEMIVEALHDMVHGITGSQKKTRYFFPIIATYFLFILANNYFGLLPGVGTIGMIEKEAAPTEEHSMQLIPQVSAVTVESDHSDAETTPSTETSTVTETEAPHAEGEAAAEHGPVFVPFLRAGTADLNTTLALALISVVMTQVIGFQYLGIHYFQKYINFSNPINFFVGFLEIISEFAKIMSFAFRLFGNIFAGEVLLVVIAAISPSVLKAVTPLPFYGLELFVGFIQALVFSMLTLVFFNMATISHDTH